MIRPLSPSLASSACFHELHNSHIYASFWLSNLYNFLPSNVTTNVQTCASAACLGCMLRFLARLAGDLDTNQPLIHGMGIYAPRWAEATRAQLAIVPSRPPRRCRHCCCRQAARSVQCQPPRGVEDDELPTLAGHRQILERCSSDLDLPARGRSAAARRHSRARSSSQRALCSACLPLRLHLVEP